MSDSVKKYGQWAVITGGSAGIGLAFSHELAKRGHDLILVARDAERLEESKSELEAKHGVSVVTEALDVTAPGAVERVLEVSADLDVGLVVLNAGMELSGHFTVSELDAQRRLLDLNARVPMEMAHRFGARFVRRGRGGILFVSSLFGYQGVPLVAGYSATKAYVLTLGEALSVELRPFGVDVTVLSPGYTDTQMPANMPIDFSKLPIPRMSPRRAARVGMNALGRKISVVPGFINKVYAWENRLLPRSTPIKMFGFLVRRAFKKEQAASYLLSAGGSGG